MAISPEFEPAEPRIERRGVPLDFASADACLGDVGSVSRIWLNETLPRVLHDALDIDDVDIIDVGCGDGHVLGLLQDLSAQGRYVGFDLAPRPSWQEPPKGNVASTFHVRDAHDIESVGASATAAISVMAFEHLDDDRRVLAALRDIVDDGVIIIAVPAPAARLYLGARHCFRWYRPEDLEGLASSCGLSVERLVTQRSLLGLVVDSARCGAATTVARATRIFFYALSRGDRAEAARRHPWLRDINRRFHRRWLAAFGGRAARWVAISCAAVDARLPGVTVSHIAVLRRRVDA